MFTPAPFMMHSPNMPPCSRYFRVTVLLLPRKEWPGGNGARPGMEAMDGEHRHDFGAKYDSNLAATVKGLLESTSSQSLIHTWIQDQPHYLRLLTPLLTIPEPCLKIVAAPKIPDRNAVIYITVADSGLSMVSGGKRKLRKYDFKECLDTSRPARVGAWKSEMLWGKGLQ